MFNMLVILYLFLGGAGGGLLLVTTTGSLWFYGSLRRSRETTGAFSNVVKRCYVVGLFFLLFAASCLVADLGQPTRMLSLFIRPSFSALSMGTFALSATIILTLFLVAVNFLAVFRVSTKIKKTAELLCAVSSFFLISYVGVFLQTMQTIPFWDSAAIPILFIVSSLSLGMALIFLVTSFVSVHVWLKWRIALLHRCHVLTLVLEAGVLAFLLWHSTLNATALRSLELLLFSDMRFWFYIGSVGFGIIVPLLAELYSIISKKVFLLPIAQIFCLIGGFCLRYCIVSVGLH